MRPRWATARRRPCGGPSRSFWPTSPSSPSSSSPRPDPPGQEPDRPVPPERGGNGQRTGLPRYRAPAGGRLLWAGPDREGLSCLRSAAPGSRLPRSTRRPVRPAADNREKSPAVGCQTRARARNLRRHHRRFRRTGRSTAFRRPDRRSCKNWSQYGPGPASRAQQPFAG